MIDKSVWVDMALQPGMPLMARANRRNETAVETVIEGPPASREMSNGIAIFDA
jgi:hypothetical protein